MGDRATTIVVSLPDLLWATGTETIEELARLVDDDCDVDLWVDATDSGIEIGAGLWAICLDYPFHVAAFWATVQEVEAEEIRRWESAAVKD